MSAGSNNIVIQISDQVDDTIAVKITGIATAARLASTELATLQSTLAGLSTNNLSSVLATISTATAPAAANVLTLSTNLAGIGQATRTVIPALTATQVAAVAMASGLNTIPVASAAAQAAVSKIVPGVLVLSQGLGALPAAAGAAAVGTGRLTGAIAQLLSRVVGAELGMGMLGGAFGRVAVAAGIAGPLIAAAFAVGAIVAYVLWQNHLEKQSLALNQAQAQVAETNSGLNDKLLDQKETLIGLTQGPLAKYIQQLKDLDFKTIKIDVTDLNKEWKEEGGFLQNLIPSIERYAIALKAVSAARFGEKGPAVQSRFDTDDVTRFVAAEEKKRLEGKNTTELLKQDQAEIVADAKKAVDAQQINQRIGLEREIQDIKRAISEKLASAASQSGALQAQTFQGIDALKEIYNRDLLAYAVYLGEKKALQSEAAGDTLAVQRKLASDQLKQFNDELSQLKDQAGVLTPQATLALRQAQLAGTPRDTAQPGSLASKPALPLNQDTIKRDIANATEAIDRQKERLKELVDRYKEQTDASGAYSNALRIESDVRRAALQIEKIKHDGDPATLAAIRAQITATVDSADASKHMLAIFDQFQGPLIQYQAALTAIAKLEKDGAIAADQAAIARAKAARVVADAINPLNEYAISLQHEISLLSSYGRELNVATEVDRIRQTLLKEGRELDSASVADLIKKANAQEQLTTDQQRAKNVLSDYLAVLQAQKNIQTELNKLTAENSDLVRNLIEKQVALNFAKDKGIISETQYKIATSQLNIQLADQANLSGKNATLITQLTGGIGKYIQNYQGLAKGLSDAYGQAFTTIADGAANSLGRAIAYGEDLAKALQNVARQALSELISGFIKLGIQWVINELLAKTLGAAALVATSALATATAAAWAPAAALSAIATFGASAAAADIAMAQSVGVAGALALAKFAGGGYFQGAGTRTSDSNLARISDGEFIVNADATAKNRGTLEAINSGSSVGSNMNLNVQVIHDGSTAIHVQQIDEHTVRVIAKYEAKNAVSEHGPNVIAADIQNPNSRTSKAMSQNLETKRRR